ncbi:MAG: ankyrin repeat domain-containing protein [Rubripirellula sp.]|nr:ankyrin repeat domain-containing protein [Rubripirellula sp.]
MNFHRFIPVVLSLGLLVASGCSSETNPKDVEDTPQNTTMPDTNSPTAATSDDSEQEPIVATEATPEPTKPTEPQMSGEAFRLAAHDGKLSIVRNAIESGMDIESKDPAGRHTALHMAAFNGHTETVKYLIGQGAAIDPPDNKGMTPLIHACTGPFVETVKVLIDAGANVNAKDQNEAFTPLMTAAALGQPEIVQVLLDNGADKTIRDEDNELAVDHARNAGHEDIIKILQAE